MLTLHCCIQFLLIDTEVWVCNLAMYAAGKTMMAKAIAKESGAVFINVRIANLQSKWFGDANKLVTAVFTLAWKCEYICYGVNMLGNSV